MGAQFWWFYDVLFLSIAGGILYHTVQKGFRKEVLKTILFVMVVTGAFAGASFLSIPVYEKMFQEKIITTLQEVLESGQPDIFENASESLALTALEGEETPDAEGVRKMAEKAITGEECPEWFVEIMGNSTDALISRYVRPHSEKTLLQYFSGNIPAFQLFLQECETAPRECAELLEALYYKQAYCKLLTMVLFLLILFVIGAVFNIVSSLVEYSGEQGHITGKSRILAIPLGLMEVAGGTAILTAAIRLTMALTDGQMLIFNQETMNHTIIFRYVYHFMLKYLTV